MAADRQYALSIFVDGRFWYLSRAANFGNLMRTSDPFSARTWPSVAELQAWVDDLPEKTKDQLADREFDIKPLRIVPEVASQKLVLKTVETPETEAPAHAS